MSTQISFMQQYKVSIIKELKNILIELQQNVEFSPKFKYKRILGLKFRSILSSEIFKLSIRNES